MPSDGYRPPHRGAPRTPPLRALSLCSVLASPRMASLLCAALGVTSWRVVPRQRTATAASRAMVVAAAPPCAPSAARGGRLPPPCVGFSALGRAGMHPLAARPCPQRHATRVNCEAAAACGFSPAPRADVDYAVGMERGRPADTRQRISATAGPKGTPSITSHQPPLYQTACLTTKTP